MFGLGRDHHLEPSEIEALHEQQGYGGQSMTGHLRRVIVQQPTPPTSPDDWKRFGYTHPINHEQTLAEFDAFCSLLEQQGIDIVRQEPDEAGRLDSIFVYDTSIVTDAGVVLAHPGKDVRRLEVEYARSIYQNLDVPIIGEIQGAGILEGGDTFWLEEHVRAVGLRYRTNSTGIDQLSTFLRPHDVNVLRVDLPHWRGPDECLHLLSLISPVAERMAVVHSPLISTTFMQILNDLDWTLIDIPEEEFATQATNVLALAPGKVLMLEENVGTIRRLEAHGVEVLTYKGRELSHNRQGGPTCLTKPLLRSMPTA